MTRAGGAARLARARSDIHVDVTHVKPHGALNNVACVDADVAAAICRAVQAVDASLIVLAPAGSELLRAAEAHELPAAAEVFAALDGAQMLVNAGGGNLATRWHSHVFERATLARLARLRGVPVVVTGQTLGPDLDAPDDAVVARMLREAVLVGVREPDTAALVDSWGLSATLNVDDASFLGLGEAGEAGASAPRGGVVVSLSGWFAGRPADEVEQRVADLADAAALSFLMPVFTAIILAVWMREHLTGPRITALALGLGGAFVVIRPGFTEVV